MIITFILAIKRTFFSGQTYFLGDFNILVQTIPSGVSLDPIKYSVW